MTGPGPVAPRDVQLATGAPLRLAPMLAKAGEGVVYGVQSRPGLVAKVFHPDLKDLTDKLGKVSAMIGSPPPDRVQANGFVVLTWPTAMIFDAGRPIGYLMPRIDTATAVEIHTMSNPSHRADPLPNEPQWTRNATWGHLVNTAANLCLAVEVVHRVDAVIGDFQERNILVSDTTQVTLVDCDSMQFIDVSGHQFLCGVGRPEFTAPELAGVDLRVAARAKSSDLFALAIHIHQLLMAGNHPFMRGTWTGGGEQPDALPLARIGAWAGGPGSPLLTHPAAPPITFLPNEIQRLFIRAFSEGARNPSARPTAQEWRDALLRIQLTQCPRGLHQIPVTTAVCPWCAIDGGRAARQQQQVRAGAVRQLPAPATGPVRTGVRAPTNSRVARKNSLYATLNKHSTIIIAGLITFVVVVVILTIFIVWALLSGTSTFGG